MVNMRKTKKNIIKSLFTILILLGATGSLLFFPLRMEEGYTCIYHLKFDHDNPVMEISKIVSGGEYYSNSVNARFMHEYIHNWALLWWLSLAVAGTGLYGVIKNRNNNNTIALKRLEDSLDR